MVDFFTNTSTIITLIAMAIGGVVGYLGIVDRMKKNKAEERMAIIAQMKTNATDVKSHIDERLKVVDSKFESVHTKLSKNKEDIADIEVDIKQMVFDFKGMCEKLQKHDYVIESVTPEFRLLQRDFYKFKSAIEIMTAKKSPTVNGNDDEDDSLVRINRTTDDKIDSQ